MLYDQSIPDTFILIFKTKSLMLATPKWEQLSSDGDTILGGFFFIEDLSVMSPCILCMFYRILKTNPDESIPKTILLNFENKMTAYEFSAHASTWLGPYSTFRHDICVCKPCRLPTRSPWIVNNRIDIELSLLSAWHESAEVLYTEEYTYWCIQVWIVRCTAGCKQCNTTDIVPIMVRDTYWLDVSKDT